MKRWIKNEPIAKVLAIGLNPLLIPFKPQKRSTSEQKMFIKSFHPQYNTIKLQRENIISNRHLTINRRNYSSQVKLTKRRQQRKSSTSLSLHPFFGTTEIENPPYFSWLSYDTSINPYFSTKSIHIQVHYHFIHNGS